MTNSYDEPRDLCCIIAVKSSLAAKMIDLKNKLKYFLIIVIPFAILSCNSGNSVENDTKQNEDYVSAILQKRIQTDAEFRDEDNSPLREKKERDAFSGLNYFDVDEIYKVNSFVNKTNAGDTIYLKTSTDESRAYLVYGTSEFKLNGINCELKIYKGLRHVNHPTYSKILLVPFLDETSNILTYGGGRYLEVQIPEGDSLLLDFNKAFNPYCHYTSGYSCTKVPFENTLALEVLAGEMKYGDSKH